MSIKAKILFWFLLPSIFIATIAASYCYFYTKNTIEQNMFVGLEMAAEELREHVQSFLKGKIGRTIDFSSDGFIKRYTEEITRRDDRFMFYTDLLNTHLVLDKSPLDPDIIATFVVDLTGKIIGSSEFGLLNKDVSGNIYFKKTIKRG